jgi:hypothetical protein
MAHRRRSNQGAALTRVEWVLICARRVAVHAPEASKVRKRAPVEVPSRKHYDLRVALENAGVDMGKARSHSAGAIKANETIKMNKEKRK